MKIALELQPCCAQKSGIGYFTYELAKRFVPTTDIELQGNVFNFINRNDNEDNLKDLSMPVKTNKIMPYGLYRRIWRFVPVPYNALFPEADITHFFSYIVPPKIKGKVITTIHDLAYLFYPETLNPPNLKMITKDIAYSIKRSDMIVTVSENSKKDIMKHLCIDKEKIKVIYNASAEIKSTETLQSVQKRFRFNKNYILYVGNLEPRKNIPSLLKAFHRLIKENGIDYQLVLAGQKGWLYDEIFNTVSRLELGENVTFTGYVSNEEKSALYKNASLFVYPSFYEGFGIPIIEAMSAGVPVVCSNTSSMPEAAGDAALFADPHCEEELAAAVYTALYDKKLRDKMIALGNIQSSKFSWDKSAAALMELYKDLGKKRK